MRTGRWRRQVIGSFLGLLLLLGWAAQGGSNAVTPSLISSVGFDGPAIAVAAARGHAFVVVDTGAREDPLVLEIVSLLDPRAPSRVGSVRIQKSISSDRVRVQAIERWIIVTEWPSGTTGGPTFAFDTSDLTAPSQTAPGDCPILPTRTADNAQFFSEGTSFGGYQFLPDAHERLVAQLLGTLPLQVVPIPEVGVAKDVSTVGDLVLVAEGPGAGLGVLRVGPAPSFTPLTAQVTIPTPGSAQALSVAGGYVLIADGTAGLTIVEGPIPPGTLFATVDTPGNALDVAATENLALIADGGGGLQVIELPEPREPLVRPNELPETVHDLRVADISPALELAPATYSVSFVLPAWGGLSGAAGDTISLSFPTGTAWIPFPAATMRLPSIAGVTASIGSSTSTLSISLPSAAMVPGGTRVILDIQNSVNPPAGTEYAILVSTTRNPSPAFSNPYTIQQDALGWLAKNVIPPLTAIQNSTLAIERSLTTVAEDVKRTAERLDSISKTLDGLSETIGLISDNTADVKDLLERKVELEEEIAGRLEGLEGTASQLASYLYEKLQLERAFAAALDELLGTANEIRSGVETKIELEEEMNNLLQDLADCLANLELTGELLPPFEARSPLDLVLALDSSGSMENNDPNRLAAGGAATLLDKLDWKTDQAGLVSWDDNVDFQTALGGNPPALKNQLGQVDQDGNTNFDVGLTTALDVLNNARPGTRKVIIFLTDGEGDYTLPGNPGSQVDRAKNADVQIYTIGLGNAPDMAKLKAMAEATGGRALHAKQAADLAQIYRTLAQELMNPWFVRLQAECGAP